MNTANQPSPTLTPELQRLLDIHRAKDRRWIRGWIFCVVLIHAVFGLASLSDVATVILLVSSMVALILLGIAIMVMLFVAERRSRTAD